MYMRICGQYPEILKKKVFSRHWCNPDTLANSLPTSGVLLITIAPSEQIAKRCKGVINKYKNKMVFSMLLRNADGCY